MMKPLKSALTALLVSLGRYAMADTAPTATTEFNIDFNLTGGIFDLRVNDVPVFGPGAPLDTPASIISSFPLNAYVYNGTNTVTLGFTAKEDAVEPPQLRVRFEHIQTGSFPEIFGDRPFAADTLIPGTEDRDHTYIPGTMPSLTGSETAQFNDGTLGFSLTANSDRPAPSWPDGQIITADRATFTALVSEAQRAHGVFAQGRKAMEEQFQPFLAHMANGFGMDVSTFLDFDYAVFADPSQGYVLQDFDASNSEVQIYGNGRLAILVPSPVVFLNAEFGETASAYLYYWKDDTGAWRMME